MRRRARRPGETPKVSGVPTFLLLNLVSIAYMGPLVWRAVTQSMESDPRFFAFHMLGVLVAALGSGASAAAGALQVRGARSDAFLEPLPLNTFARLGLQLADAFAVIPLALVVPVAGLSARHVLGWDAPVCALLGLLAYVASFVVAQALVAWARVLGPASTARRSAYAGVALSVGGLVSTFLPLGQWIDDGGTLAALATHAWLGRGIAMYGLYAATGLTCMGRVPGAAFSRTRRVRPGAAAGQRAQAAQGRRKIASDSSGRWCGAKAARRC